MTYSYLIDNRLYRLLTTSRNGQGLRDFNTSFEKVDIIERNAPTQIGFKITSFTILEGLGITVPDPALILPPDLVRQNKVVELINFVLRESKLFYQNSPCFKKQYLLDRAENQSKSTLFEGRKLEKICINTALASAEFEEHMINCLSFDYVCKFDFPKEIQNSVMKHYLLSSFFIDHGDTSGLSKFRIAKRLWDLFYNDSKKKNIYPKEKLEEMNKSMKLKRKKDYLDCELIHFASIGDCVKGEYIQVVAFTCDERQNVINRIAVYKSLINYCIEDLLDDKDAEKYKKLIGSFKQGIVCFCNDNCSIESFIEVETIEPFK